MFYEFFSKKQVEYLRDILEANEADCANHYKFDEKIHVTITDITNNPLFVVVLQSLHLNLLYADYRFAPRSPEKSWDNYEGLAETVTTIESGDAEAAEQAVRSHEKVFNMHIKE